MADEREEIARIIDRLESSDPDFDDCTDAANMLRAILARAQGPGEAVALGTRVRKKSGSRWQGKVVGYYSTELTPQGVCIESENEPGSVQIYPIRAVEVLEGATPHPDEQELQDILSEAMSDVHDMDTTTTDFAKACVKKLQELKIIP